MKLEKGLWAYDRQSGLWGRLDYLDDSNGWGFMPLFGCVGYAGGHSDIDWPNLEIFTIRDVEIYEN